MSNLADFEDTLNRLSGEIVRATVVHGLNGQTFDLLGTLVYTDGHAKLFVGQNVFPKHWIKTIDGVSYTREWTRSEPIPVTTPDEAADIARNVVRGLTGRSS